MTIEEIPQFVELFTAIRESYGKGALSRAATMIEFQTLAEYSFDEVVDAAAAHKRDPDGGRFCPTSAHLIAKLELSVDTQARVAWNRLHETIANVGRYNSWTFDDPVLHYALESIGGQETVCNMDEEEHPHVERRFIQHYLDGRARNLTWESPDVPAAFIGLSDQQNKIEGRSLQSVHNLALGHSELREPPALPESTGVLIECPDVIKDKLATVARSIAPEPPEPITDEKLAERREFLKRQAEILLSQERVQKGQLA